jgi:hypothetical protein
MSTYIAHYGLPVSHEHSDADILLRIGFTLAAWQRSAWRAVRVRASKGVVRLEGRLPSSHDRHLILSVAQHVAGVLRVEDELTVAERELEPRPALETPAEPILVVDCGVEAEVKQPAPPNAFYHLPVLDESLEDILAKRGQAGFVVGIVS